MRYESPKCGVWIFRTTDLDSVRAEGSRASGKLTLTCRSLLGGAGSGRRRLTIEVTADPSSFCNADPIWVPTLDGFSDNPGCVESHAAVVRATATGGDDDEGSGPWVEEIEMTCAALEFGGEFRSGLVQ